MIEYMDRVGKVGTIYCNEMQVEVKVLDIKKTYGRLRYLVTPVAGSGQVWVENINFKDKK